MLEDFEIMGSFNFSPQERTSCDHGRGGDHDKNSQTKKNHNTLRKTPKATAVAASSFFHERRAYEYPTQITRTTPGQETTVGKDHEYEIYEARKTLKPIGKNRIRHQPNQNQLPRLTTTRMVWSSKQVVQKA